MTARRLVAALAVTLACATPAMAARPGYTIQAEQMPTDVATARAMLVQARSWAPPGTPGCRYLDDRRST